MDLGREEPLVLLTRHQRVIRPK